MERLGGAEILYVEDLVGREECRKTTTTLNQTGTKSHRIEREKRLLEVCNR